MLAAGQQSWVMLQALAFARARSAILQGGVLVRCDPLRGSTQPWSYSRHVITEKAPLRESTRARGCVSTWQAVQWGGPAIRLRA